MKLLSLSTQIGYVFQQRETSIKLILRVVEIYAHKFSRPQLFQIYKISYRTYPALMLSSLNLHFFSPLFSRCC